MSGRFAGCLFGFPTRIMVAPEDPVLAVRAGFGWACAALLARNSAALLYRSFRPAIRFHAGGLPREPQALPRKGADISMSAVLRDLLPLYMAR